MELMWFRDDHAGFRFFEEVDVQRLIEDKRDHYPRRPIRVRTDFPATVHSGSRRRPIIMRDISMQGACIETPERLLLRQLVKIDLPGFPQIYAKVCWRKEPRHGLVLETSFTMEELALHLLLHEHMPITMPPAPSNSVARRLVTPDTKAGEAACAIFIPARRLTLMDVPQASPHRRKHGQVDGSGPFSDAEASRSDRTTARR
jgi:hypothetical protein